MDLKAKREYLAEIRERYQGADRAAKGAILNEFCQVCGYSRKHAIARLRAQERLWMIRRPGPKRIYGPEVTKWLVLFWNKMRRICSKAGASGLDG